MSFDLIFLYLYYYSTNHLIYLEILYAYVFVRTCNFCDIYHHYFFVNRNDSGVRAEKEKPQRADALNFLSSIKDGFGSGSQEYKYFVDLLIEYKQQR